MTETVTTNPPTPVGRAGGGSRQLVIGVAAQLVAGVVVGLVWLAWSPHTVAYLVQGPGAGTVLIPAEAENQVAGDGRFVLLSLGVGVVAGFIAWFGGRSRRGPVVLALLAATGLVSAVVARTVGELLAGGSSTGAAGSVVHPALSLHGTPMLAVQALGAVFVYTVLAGVSSDTDFVDPATRGAIDTAHGGTGGSAHEPQPDGDPSRGDVSSGPDSGRTSWPSQAPH